MRYLGGKHRISAALADIMNKYLYNKPFVSLFCGACNVEAKIKSDRKICNDKHKYLIAMWQALQNGYELPDSISEEQYRYISANRDKDKALAGFVGFACSFGGKWFAGYARDERNGDYGGRGKRHTLKCFDGLKNAEFMCMDYRDVPIPDDAVIYADPPYLGSTGYKGMGKFDGEAFWQYMRVLSKEHLVFISEQNAPEDFVAVWEQEYRRGLRKSTGSFTVTEKLFVYEKRSEVQAVRQAVRRELPAAAP